MVYDITVPNHVFFCRRNGKASWTGNCWKGHLTIEISNAAPLPARIYAGEGIAQVLFFRTDGWREKMERLLVQTTGLSCPNTSEQLLKEFYNGRLPKTGTGLHDATCDVSYADRKGRYDGQTEITLPFVEKE